MAGDDSEVTLNAFGKTVSIKGLGTIFVFIVLAFASGLAWMLYNLSMAATRSVEAALEVQRTTALEHRVILDATVSLQSSNTAINDNVKQTTDSLKTQNYILLADTIERADIKRRMSMPKELRELGVREKRD